MAKEAASKFRERIINEGRIGEDKEHPFFGWMKEFGGLEKMYSTFKECVNEETKRDIGLGMIHVDRGCFLGEKTFEVVKWLRDNTTTYSNGECIRDILHGLRPLVLRFFSILHLLLNFLSFSFRLSRRDVQPEN
jgi:hypothetical protein